MFEKRVLNIYAVIIGFLFIISGIGKVIDTAGFSTLIFQYGLGYLMVLSPVIVLFEILLGLLLILLVNPKRYAFISFVLLTIFSILFAYAYLKNGVTDCGCFGSIQHANISPVFSFFRNFILILMSLILWIKYPKSSVEPLKWKKNLILAVMISATFIAGFTFKMPYFLLSKPTNHSFQDKQPKNTPLSDYIKTSVDSTYLVFCFSYTCPYCLNSIENLRKYKTSKTVDRVVVLAIGDKKDKAVFMQNFQPDFAIQDLKSEQMDKLTNAYPTAFYITHDTIKIVVQSELPSPYIFKKTYDIK